MPVKKPYATSVFTWLTDNLGKRWSAGFCSNDGPALQAAVHIVALMGYEYPHHPELVAAWKACVEMMQPHCQRYAYHATAHVLDWNDRTRLWALAGLPEIDVGLCAYEPAARNR